MRSKYLDISAFYDGTLRSGRDAILLLRCKHSGIELHATKLDDFARGHQLITFGAWRVRTRLPLISRNPHLPHLPQIHESIHIQTSFEVCQHHQHGCSHVRLAVSLVCCWVSLYPGSCYQHARRFRSLDTSVTRLYDTAAGRNGRAQET